MYAFKYGAVCFLNHAPVGTSEFLRIIKPCYKNIFENSLADQFLVETVAKELRVGFNKIDVPSANIDVLPPVMLNVSQPVALDYYEEETSKLLTETNQYTQILEHKDRLDISGKN